MNGINEREMSTMPLRLSALWTLKPAKRVAPRSVSRARLRRFERLEDRSMLSASVASMDCNPGGEYVAFDQDFGPPAWEPAYFAPPPESQGIAAPGHGHGDFDTPPVNSNIGDGIYRSASSGRGEPGVGHSLAPSSSNSSQASLPPPKRFAAASAASNSTVTLDPDVSVVNLINSDFSGGKAEQQLQPPADYLGNTKQQSRAILSTGQHEAPPSSDSQFGNSNYPGSGNTPPAGSSPLRGGGSAVSQLSFEGASYFATAATTTGHTSDYAAHAANAAVDSAFQSYSPQLLLVSGTATDSAIQTQSADEQASTGDSDGDFIQLTDSPATPADFAAAERSAVDAVLARLQDIDSLPVETLADAIGGQPLIDAATALPFDSIAFAETEGGMVWIETSAATISPTPIGAIMAENTVELPALNLGVESAVGFYQAIDIGGDEFSTAASAPAARPAVEPLNGSKRADRFSKDDVANRSPKAAVITASTLAGALLWASQRKRTDDEEEQLAK